jgi:hypothetical protein
MDTSRDRFVAESLHDKIQVVEAALMELGCGLTYFTAIQNNMKRGGKPFTLVKYLGALKRTLAAKQRGMPVESSDPF